MFSTETAEGDIVFSFGTGFTWRVKAGTRSKVAKTVNGPALTPAVILFIALPETKDNSDLIVPLECLPRRCPACREDSIIGHGRRLRQAHDEHHECIWIRRGICRLCRKTFTILPDWLAPAAQFSLRCRQQACERIAAGHAVEHAVPYCKDLSRSPDPSTVRRWAQRRLSSVCCWLTIPLLGEHFLRAPTIVAWDMATVCRILPVEARSP